MNGRTTLRNSRAGARALEQGRNAFRNHAWGEAFSQLFAADRQSSMAAEDLIDFAQAALLTGREAEGGDLLACAHQAFLSAGDIQGAPRCAFWLEFTWLINAEFAKAGG